MNTADMEKPQHQMVTLHYQLEKRTAQFNAALPGHIPVERFKRVVLTAIQHNPALASADRQTLWNSAMKAAQDGLLPDGREAALVIYKTKIKDGARDIWIDAVQYLPMIAGVRKRVRNSGEIATWEVNLVHEKDAFNFELGDEPFIKHKPFLAGDRGKIIAAYSVAVLKGGEKSREVMMIHEIERIRQLSKAKDKGPWTDHYGEMCRKTVAKRHAKVLPLSTDLDDLIRRDDNLYDFDEARQGDKAERPKLSDFADAPMNAPQAPAAAEGKAGEAQEGDLPSPSPAPPAESSEEEEPGHYEAMQLGYKARQENKPRKCPPEMQAFEEAWCSGWDECDAEMRSK